MHCKWEKMAQIRIFAIELCLHLEDQQVQNVINVIPFAFPSSTVLGRFNFLFVQHGIYKIYLFLTSIGALISGNE
jgi:hypothetical protein